MIRELSIRALMAAVLLLLLGGVCLAGTSGVAVDAKSGKPVEGAVVVMQWTVTKGLGNTYHEVYQVYERVTDKKDGRFSVPGVLNRVDPPTMAVYSGAIAVGATDIRSTGRWKKTRRR